MIEHTDRDLLVYLLAQYDRLLEIHGRVVMDTPKDVVLHNRAMATAAEAADPVREHLRSQS